MNIGQTSLDGDNWDGVYSYDSTTTSFNAPIWTVSNSNKWLKYIETHWVLSGENDELLIYNASNNSNNNNIFPPTEQTTEWIHEYDANTIQVRLVCSSTYSPTNAPTNAPSTSPTYSPTVSECDILIVSDSSPENDVSDPLSYFNNWFFERHSQGDIVSNRPVWQYEDNDNENGDVIESSVVFTSAEGWVVFFNDGYTNTLYANGKLFGYYPPLGEPQLFNITTNGAKPRIFNFTCLPTNYPTSAPTKSPTNAPSDSPSNEPTYQPPTNQLTSSPTSAPTDIPTIAPSILCEVLEIGIPVDLSTNNYNPNCDINFTAIFDNNYWLQQISRNNRPSWTLDCDDSNPQYTTACNNGYSGSIFFISNQWEIQLHSKTDDCFERFIIDNTRSYFIPLNANWSHQSTNIQYLFQIQCTDKLSVPTPPPTGAALVTTNTVTIVDQTWFWIALILLLLICCLLIGAYFYWNKQKKPVVVYEPRPVKSISHAQLQHDLHGIQMAEADRRPSGPGAQGLDLEVVGDDGNINSNEDMEGNDDLKLDEVRHEHDGQINITRIGSTLGDPNINPNLRQVSVVSVISAAAAKGAGGTSVNIDGDHDGEYKINAEEEEEKGNGDDIGLEMEQKQKDQNQLQGDKALDLIAGKGSPGGPDGYNVVAADDHDDDDDDDEADELDDDIENDGGDEELYERHKTIDEDGEVVLSV